tara:strand:+ start:758 stop:961 length:204 start_codon:yes stop_codon:yes gene_type:complete
LSNKTKGEKLNMSEYIVPSKYKIIISSDNLEEIEQFENLMTEGLNIVAPYRVHNTITIQNNLSGYWV